MTILFDETGPLVRYDGSALTISDLNPEQEMHWRMSRWGMARFAVKALAAALFAKSPAP